MTPFLAYVAMALVAISIIALTVKDVREDKGISPSLPGDARVWEELDAWHSSLKENPAAPARETTGSGTHSSNLAR